MARKLQFNTYWNEAQKECFRYLLWHPEVTEIGYGWAAGGWKSYTWVSWQWMMRNKYPGTRGFFWREELKRLKQTTLQTYFKFCDDYEIPQSQRGNYNAQDSVIKFSNGSEILLLDLAYLPSDPLYQRFGSLELTDWYVDESSEVAEQCITILMTRIGRQRNEEYWLAPKLLEGFNPDKGQVFRRYYKPWKDWTLPTYRTFIRALATDNKRLPKSYVEQLMKADEVTKQRLLYGNFEYDSTPGRLFEYDALTDLFTNPRNNGDKFVSVDVAREWKDSTVICVWDWLEIVEIITEAKSKMDSLSDKIKVICQKYGVWASRTVVDENGVWGGLVDNLRCQGFINNAKPIEPKSPNLSQKRNFEHLKTQCYFELSRLVNDRKIRINCDERIRNAIIEELDAVVQIDIDKDGKYKLIKKEDVKEKIGRSPDYSDAIMMRMIYEIKKFSGISQPTEKKDERTPLDIIIDEWDWIRDEEEFELILNPY